MMGPGFGYMPDYMSWMMFVSVLFWSLVIALAFVVLYRRSTAHGSRRPGFSDTNALEGRR
jgi:heme/copper-type cytochrome/quinol oxidase subunit 2